MFKPVLPIALSVSTVLAVMGSCDPAPATTKAPDPPRADPPSLSCDWCCNGGTTDCSCTSNLPLCPLSPPAGTPCGNMSACQGSCTKGKCKADKVTPAADVTSCSCPEIKFCGNTAPSCSATCTAPKKAVCDCASVPPVQCPFHSSVTNDCSCV